MKQKPKIERELQYRVGEDDDSVDDVIERLLDKTRKVVAIDEVVTTAIEEVDDVACVVVEHPKIYIAQPGELWVTVYTSAVAPGEERCIDLFGPDHVIALDRDGSTVHVPFTVRTIGDGPAVVDTSARTTVFTADTQQTESPLDVDDGLQHLHEKLTAPESWTENRSETKPPLARIRDDD